MFVPYGSLLLIGLERGFSHMTEFWADVPVRLEAKFDRPEVTLCG